MNETDRLLSAHFAAAMIANQPDPTVQDYFEHYDACIAVLVAREAEAAVRKEERTLAAHKKAWG